jgi:TctA family transporter
MNDTEARRKLAKGILKVNLLSLTISTAVGTLSGLFYGLITFGTCIILLPATKQLIRRKHDQ